ncbi:glycine C-acetyltransferase [Boudabousia marimammalium]|uniref:2-amino-3-ketobutyrate coenzyme A ligase n=1 Tax=Boudabousia marimammalium TaxID=156892 RepID=A0A1Q5PSP6_9ACTO|nr:glycine C-acetyltransferase [Boudabousia marimammalium]OKL50597.1 glycine C-acetyltransferase [Boudabousia marimammalium]
MFNPEGIRAELDQIREAGLYKNERTLTTPQSAQIATSTLVAEGEGAPLWSADGAAESLNFCANNYLGLANDPRIVQAAHEALDRWGFGMSSVRFICGTQGQHRDLEREIAEYVGTDDAILFSSCYDANGGIFEVLLSAEDAVISDELNHASLIDGIRLCKAKRFRYRNANMEDLRAQLTAAKEAGSRRMLIVTDGVFSMDGSYAPLDEICDLADEFGAMVMVDDSHATGFVGPQGRGTPHLFGVADRVDVITSTLGKALGGASGGFVAAHQEIVDLARQRARTYLFSNAVAPAVVAGSRKALELARDSEAGREQLAANSALFRSLMAEAGFDLLPGTHPITAVMFPGDEGAVLATQIADAMLKRGVYVIAFSFPVVPRGKARIRVQLSAAHSEADVRACVNAFVAARAEVQG